LKSCQDDHGRGPLCETDETVSTRFYDIEIAATDAAGNVGRKTCSVIVVPSGHYGGEESSKSSKGKKAGSSRKLKGGKSKGSKKSRVEEVPHDPDDLRMEYPLSTQRYVVSSLSLLWDATLNTVLVVPPLLNEIEGAKKMGKKVGKK
jgi:hypothetical protein